MFKHAVMWRIKDEGKEDSITRMSEMLLKLIGEIPQIKKMEIGRDSSGSHFSADLLLYTEFESEEDYKIYAAHPLHINVVNYVRDVILERRVVDFKV